MSSPPEHGIAGADGYAQVKDAFLELSELDHDARAERLAALASTAPGIAAAVARQLATADAPRPWFDVDAPPPTFGPYRLLRELGAGGMGRVWLAERRLGDAVQQVAFKRIAGRNFSTDDRRRFDRERRILASLAHPNIATLLDGGVDDTGLPFIATPYIDGEPLDAWSARRRPSRDARVRMLRTIAAAVAYAHGRLVVHRDLKPANIIVDRDDCPHLLDFGIGRVLDEDAVTADGPSRMTLRYAAPEQVAADGNEATTSVDIHALGLLLHQLLVDDVPHAGTTGPALLQAVLHEDLPAPSARTGSGDRDLDAICARALRKRPQDRYPSVDALVADLDRWLAGEPVEARRGERGYRLRRRLRRHRGAMLVTVAFALTAGGLLGYHLDRIDRQLAQTAHERDKARAIVHWFTELFASAPPAETRDSELTARALLQASVARLREGDTARMDDDVRASMFYAAGGIIARQGLLPEAAEMLERAITLWRGLAEPPVEDLAVALADRASYAYRLGDAAGALDWQQQALELRGGTDPASRIDRGHMLTMRAVYQRQVGDRAGSDASLAEAVSILRAHLPDSRPYLVTALGNLGTLMLFRGDATGGLALLREAQAQAERLHPRRRETELLLRRSVAAALRELGRLDESRVAFEQLIGDLTAHYGDTHFELGVALHSYGQLLLLAGDVDGAEAALTRAEAIHAADNHDHPRALLARSELARVAIARDRYPVAARLLADVAARRAGQPPVEAGILAAEAVAEAFAACMVARPAEPRHVAALSDALATLRADPPLPRTRVDEAERWLERCRTRAAVAAPDHSR